MSSINPYASPSAETPYIAKLAGAPQGIWRDGQILVLRIGAQLPPRCLKSNEPTDEIWRRKLQWHPPWVLFLILVHILIFIIVALILSKRATFDFPVTRPFRQRRRNAILVAWAIVLLGFGVLFVGGVVANEFPKTPYGGMLMLACPVLLIIGAVYGIVRSRLLWPKKIDANFAWVNGACPEYLAGLPQWPGEYEAYRLSSEPSGPY